MDGFKGVFEKGWDLFGTQLVGTICHLSPEQITSQLYSGEKVDSWQAGVILYGFLTTRLPFMSSDTMDVIRSIQSASFDESESISAGEMNCNSILHLFLG